MPEITSFLGCFFTLKNSKNSAQTITEVSKPPRNYSSERFYYTLPSPPVRVTEGEVRCSIEINVGVTRVNITNPACLDKKKRTKRQTDPTSVGNCWKEKKRDKVCVCNKTHLYRKTKTWI